MSAAHTPPFVIMGTEGSCSHVNEAFHWWATCAVCVPSHWVNFDRGENFVMMLCFVLVPNRAVITSTLSLAEKKKMSAKLCDEKKKKKSRTRPERVNLCVLCCLHLLHFLLAGKHVKGGRDIMHFSLGCCSNAHLVLSVAASSSAQSPPSSIHPSVRPSVRLHPIL